MFCLFIFGPTAEISFGRIKFLLIYLIAGVGGSATSYVFMDPRSFGVGVDGQVGPDLFAHPNGTNSFRVETDNKKIVYVTDCEHPEGSLNENVVKIATECDFLIHDSHFTRDDLKTHKGWGHSSWEQAVEVAKLSNTKKLILFHHDPFRPDDELDQIEKKAQQIFPNTIVAKQDLEIIL